MKIEIVEILLVIAIVSVQFWIFSRTYKQINIFKGIFPDISSITITKIKVPLDDLNRLALQKIIDNIPQYKEKTYSSAINDEEHLDLFQEQDHISPPDYYDEINIIECQGETNSVFDNIIYSLNKYLIRNRKSSTDFNLMKDVVERNTNAIEEDINLTVAIPLYLGLMGTMIGIIIGLFNIPKIDNLADSKMVIGEKVSYYNNDLTKEDVYIVGNARGDSIQVKNADSYKKMYVDKARLSKPMGIDILIGGVKIAMIASFMGLLLTIICSGWLFKGSRTLVESRKDEFFTFLQTELLPIVNQSLGSTFNSLQTNLLKFNNEFSGNLLNLSGIFKKNFDALALQDKILTSLEKLDISQVAKYNVKVLKELQNTTTEFEKFNQYLLNINSFVYNSEQLTIKANELLGRTDNFKNIADNLDGRLTQSQYLLEFLSTHFKNLEEHKNFVSNSVAEVGHSISDTFKDLKEHIQFSSEAVKNFSVEELDALKKALSESRTNLSNLSFLETLYKDLCLFKNSSAIQGEVVKQQLVELNSNMSKTIVILDEMNKHSFSVKTKEFTTSVKKFFSSKNKRT